MTLQELEDALTELSMADRTAVCDRAQRRYMARIYAAHDAETVKVYSKSYEERIKVYGEAEYCRDFTDVLDGFTLHARACPLWPKSFWGTGSQCIAGPPGTPRWH